MLRRSSSTRESVFGNVQQRGRKVRSDTVLGLLRWLCLYYHMRHTKPSRQQMEVVIKAHSRNPTDVRAYLPAVNVNVWLHYIRHCV